MLSMALSIIFTQMRFPFQGQQIDNTHHAPTGLFFVTFNSFLALGYIIELLFASKLYEDVRDIDNMEMIVISYPTGEQRVKE